MKVIREERTVWTHQLRGGEMKVLLPEGNHLCLSFYETEDGGEAGIKALEKMAADLAPADTDQELHVLIVRVKGTKAMAAGASVSGKFGEFVYATPFGYLTESECNERMRNCLHNSVMLHNRNKLIIRKAQKTGFMTLKAQVLFAVAVTSNGLLVRLEMQTARDLVSALHNMDFPTHSD